MNKRYSLKKDFEIKNILNHKQSVGNTFFAIYYRKKDEKTPKIALSISKKYGNAVERNYAKRVTREIIRKTIEVLDYTECLIIIKPASKRLIFSEKEKYINYLTNKINNKINKERESEK